jgi:hypothetical protein
MIIHNLLIEWIAFPVFSKPQLAKNRYPCLVGCTPPSGVISFEKRDCPGIL